MMIISRQHFKVCCIAGLILGVFCAAPSLTHAQKPEPTPKPEPTLTRIDNGPHLSLVPLTMLSIGLDGVAQRVSSPTGAAPPTVEFFLPAIMPIGHSKEFLVTTSGGNVNVRFAVSVPAGVPADAFQWEQSEVPAGNAIGRLRYSGGCSECPASFSIGVTATSREAVHGGVKINLTASSGRPVMTGITPNGGDNVEPRFEIRFQGSTFELKDSQVVATYASGLKYRLLVGPNSQLTDGRMNVIIPRLEVDRTVRVALVNPYGSSGNTTVNLPQEEIFENPAFEQVNASSEFPDAARVGDTFSVKHTNNGLVGAASGTDAIAIQALATASACNQRDFVFLGARVSWLATEIHVASGSSNPTATNPDQPVTIPGSPVAIASQPPTNAVLRSPNNTVRVSWTLEARSGDVFYQVLFRGVEVVGICNARVIQ